LCAHAWTGGRKLLTAGILSVPMRTFLSLVGTQVTADLPSVEIPA
jgi:hypothetical protein